MRFHTGKKWDELRDDLLHTDNPNASITLEQANLPLLDANSTHNGTQGVMESGVVLDAAREVRVKLYMGNVCYSSTTFTLRFHYRNVGIHGLAMVHTDLPHACAAYRHGTVWTTNKNRPSVQRH